MCQPVYHTPLGCNQLALEVMKDCSQGALEEEGSENLLGAMISKLPSLWALMILAHCRCSINVDSEW